MKKEQINFFENSFKTFAANKQIHYISLSDESTVAQIYSAINNGCLVNRAKNNPPDFYIQTDSAILGIEHFIIDGTKRNNSGSKLLQNRIFQNVEFFNGECVINEEFCLANLITCFEIEFEKHRKQIKKYKQRLSIEFPNKTIKILFAIHFYNPFKFQFVIDQKSRLDLFYFERVVNSIHSCNELDGVIFFDNFDIAYFSNNDDSWKYFYNRGFYPLYKAFDVKISGVKIKPIEVEIKDGKITVNEKIEYF